VSKSLSRRIHETRCATGLWAATGAEECSQCATGSEPSVAAAGAVSCTACPVGRARAFIAGLRRSTHETAANEASLRPQLFCVDCAAGHVAAMGSSACTRCKDGSAPENISRGACVACAPGRAGVGGACSDCQERTRRAAGAYAAEEITGSVRCVDCAARGMVSNGFVCEAASPSTVTGVSPMALAVALAVGALSFCVNLCLAAAWLLRKNTLRVPCGRDTRLALHQAKANLMARQLRGAVRAWDRYGEPRTPTRTPQQRERQSSSASSKASTKVLPLGREVADFDQLQDFDEMPLPGSEGESASALKTQTVAREQHARRHVKSGMWSAHVAALNARGQFVPRSMRGLTT